MIEATERITGLTVPDEIVDRRPGDHLRRPDFARNTIGWSAKVRHRGNHQYGTQLAPSAGLTSADFGHEPTTVPTVQLRFDGHAAGF